MPRSLGLERRILWNSVLKAVLRSKRRRMPRALESADVRTSLKALVKSIGAGMQKVKNREVPQYVLAGSGTI